MRGTFRGVTFIAIVVMVMLFFEMAKRALLRLALMRRPLSYLLGFVVSYTRNFFLMPCDGC